MAKALAVALGLMFSVGIEAVSAQDVARVSVDSAVSIDHFIGEGTADRPNIVVDISAVLRLGNGWIAYVRPWFRQPRAATWDREIYQAALQYERPGRVSRRIDIGYIASPIGLGMMDTRPGVNPTILPHLSYLQPMPGFDPSAPRIQPIASTYPLGAQATFSTQKWDTWAALVNTPLNRIFVINAPSPNPPPRPFFVVGGGMTPRTGLRLGAAIAHGAYAKASELTRGPAIDLDVTMVSFEGEYGLGHTKLRGELTRDALATSAGPDVAYAWFVQGVQGIAPRWFVAARQEGASAPPLRTGIVPGVRTRMHISEGTVGFRLSPEFTLRGSIAVRKSYTRTDRDRQVGASLVWARRWW